MRRLPTMAIGAAALALALPAAATAAPIPVSGTLDLGAESDVTAVGASAANRTGWDVAHLGDVDGDGLGDWAISAPAADPADRKDAGRVYVIAGRRITEPARISLASIKPADVLARIDGAETLDRLGAAIAGAGDFDGDGRADIVIGATAARRMGVGGPAKGGAYVVPGAALRGVVDLAIPPAGTLAITGSVPDGLLGTSVAGAGDVDGDGRADVIVGEPVGPGADQAGRAWVVYGRSGGGILDLAADPSTALRLQGGPATLTGLSVAGVGDLDGDGRAEVAVGAPHTGPLLPTPTGLGNHDGAVHVVRGQGPGTVDLTTLGDAGLTITGTEGGFLGVSVAGLGDVDGDGRADLAMGMPRADGRSRPDAGAVLVIRGRVPSGTIAAADLAATGAGWRIDGATSGDALGVSVDGAGDLDGDGRRDLLAVAPFGDGLSRDDSGVAYAVFTPATPADQDLAGLGSGGITYAGAESTDLLGGIAGGADATGDGVPDVLVGQLDGFSEKTAKLGGAFLAAGPPRVTPPAPLPPDPGVQEEVDLDRCVARNAVEFAIDDSGSMVESDPDDLRALAIELLLSKPRNEGRVFGALAFGTEPQRLFPPQAIVSTGPRANRDAIRALVRDGIGADDGGTELDRLFEAIRPEHPQAGAIILITDGMDRGRPFADRQKGGPPVYVLGIGVPKGGAEGKLLQRIAASTAGRYYPNVTARNLQAIVGRIDARLNCDLDVSTDTDTVDSIEDVPQDAEADLPAGTNSADVSITWEDPAEEFEPTTLVIEDTGGGPTVTIGPRVLQRVAATGNARTVNGVRLSGTRGQTFVTLHLTGVKAGKVRVGLRARRVRGKSATVRTQVSASRRRR